MLSLLWPVAVLGALYAVLGGSLAVLIGLRGLWAVAAAPVFATTVIGIGTIVAGWLGVAWSIPPALLIAAVIAAGIVLVRRWTGSTGIARFPRRHAWWTVGAIAVSSAALALLVFRVIGSADAISQTFDNIFHLNAIRYIVDAGIASPLEIGQFTSPSGGVPFYPAAWHATAALVVQLSGASIPLAVNAVAACTAAVVWPLGAVLLTRALLGSAPSLAVGAAIVAAAVPAFPLLLMDYGVLYPYQLSLALLPVAIAATANLLGIGRRSGQLAAGWWGLVLTGSLPGVALAHPGGFMAWLALTVPMFAVFAWRRWRAAEKTWQRVLIIAGALGYAAVGVLLLKLLRPPLPTRLWPTETGLVDAVWRSFTVTLFYPAAAWLVGIAVIIGLVRLVRRRRAEYLVAAGMWAIGALLFVSAVALPWGSLRDALTGSWYNNWPRLAAVFAVALLPLAALGIATVADAAGRVLRRRGASSTVRSVVAIAASVLAFLAFHLQSSPRAAEWADNMYGQGTRLYLLSEDERALLDRVDDLVPEDAVIAGSASTGAGLAYALADRHVLMPHALMDVSDDLQLVNSHLRDAREMPGVCDAIDRLDVDYVLDFGSDGVHSHDAELFAGVEDLQDSPAVRLIDSQGDARLYQVTACGRG